MLRDKSLIPTEAIRLAALGILASGARRYAALAGEVRHFVSRLTGPSLDLLGTSIELLRYEGLIEPVDGTKAGAPTTADTVFAITPHGRETLNRLLTAHVRAVSNDFNKLVVALKMRFLHLLAPADQLMQAEILADVAEGELARLSDLLAHESAAGDGYLGEWLTEEIRQVEVRLAWFRRLETRLKG